ncbi:hypothetical protein GCM10011575_22940 [Microlunatus endophyticus]|uniref:Uncharacterized protein n=1 Tax=Microlunatus endophyticus TaxID=1716077 RepID=A0A917S8N9_9ACTN|nr:hypothetical protein GCM10011575_22940 [Microlunatus endophyticus]
MDRPDRTIEANSDQGWGRRIHPQAPAPGATDGPEEANEADLSTTGNVRLRTAQRYLRSTGGN